MLDTFNYDIFNLNEQVAKETELRSFLTSRDQNLLYLKNHLYIS
jgi:hypothetical protein